MEEAPKNVEGEIFSEALERGEIRSIDEEIVHTKELARQHGVSIANVEKYDLRPLLDSQSEGYRYVLRLPRVNEAACATKYGAHFDKLEAYHEFVRNLAKRAGIQRMKLTRNADYAFETREDAELLRDRLIERQESADLEFETIENSSPQKLLPKPTSS